MLSRKLDDGNADRVFDGESSGREARLREWNWPKGSKRDVARGDVGVGVSKAKCGLIQDDGVLEFGDAA